MKNYTALSVKNPAKSKCGDASFAGSITIGQDEYVLLIVADGVSRAPKDWLASSSTVDFIAKELAQSSLPVPEAFKAAIEAANRKICGGVENTYGMLSTLSALLYSQKEGKLWLINVGDSRIYGLKNGTWEQLTADDSTNIPYKENGKLKLQNGVPLMMNALTKAIGQPGIEVSATDILTGDYEAVALASDGFYGLSRFEDYVERFIWKENMDQAAKEIQNEILPEIMDDASLAVLRLPATGAIDLKTVISQSAEAKVPTIAVLNILETELRKAIVEKDNGYTDKILNFMQEKNIFYGKEKMIVLLEFMIANQSPAVYKMTTLIRKL